MQADHTTATGDETKSGNAQTSQAGQLLPPNMSKGDSMLPANACRGFSRSSLQANSQAQVQGSGIGLPAEDNTNTTLAHDANLISCSPAMSEVSSLQLAYSPSRLAYHNLIICSFHVLQAALCPQR